MTNPVIDGLYDLIDDLETNLQTMGVDTEFDESTGIRGLISEILNIDASVGGIDVVTSLSCTLIEYGSLTLTSDKTVLSYVDEDSCTLTANYTGSTSATVQLYKSDDTLISTMTNNNDGTYTYTYNSNEIGNISFYAKCGDIESDVITIEDVYFYDNQSSNKTSVYANQQGTPVKTYVANEYIELTGSSNAWNSVSPVSLSTSDHWIFEADLMQPSIQDKYYLGFTLIPSSYSSSISSLLYSNEFASYNYGTNSYIFRDSNVGGVINTWYHMKLELNNETLYYYLYDDEGTLLSSQNTSLPSTYINTNVYPSIVKYTASGSANVTRFRNVKVTRVIIGDTNSISLTTDKSVLSYANSDTCTLTATLTDENNNGIEGETITFKKGTTILGTDTTDNDGVAEYTYTSTGEGDVSFSVEYNELADTIVVEDCTSYDTTEHTKSYPSRTVETILSEQNNCSISLDLKSTTYDYSCVFGTGYNSEASQIGFGTINTGGRIYRTLNGSNNHSDYGSNNDNTYYNLRFERINTTLKLYLDDVLIDTTTNSIISSFQYLNFISWRNKTLKYKNLKIKPL